jgi:hypothetical protein
MAGSQSVSQLACHVSLTHSLPHGQVGGVCPLSSSCGRSAVRSAAEAVSQWDALWGKPGTPTGCVVGACGSNEHENCFSRPERPQPLSSYRLRCVPLARSIWKAP